MKAVMEDTQYTDSGVVMYFVFFLITSEMGLCYLGIKKNRHEHFEMTCQLIRKTLLPFWRNAEVNSLY